MTEILLAKRQTSPLTEADRATVRRVLFQDLDGVREADKRAWRKLWKAVVEAERGEVFTFDYWFPRNGKFHRLHFAMLARLYRAQERFGDFETLRTWLKVGAGFVDWYPGPRGGIVPIPKSIAFRKLDEDGMRAFHEAVVAFLRTAGAQKTLWPHVDPDRRAECAEVVLAEFDA